MLFHVVHTFIMLFHVVHTFIVLFHVIHTFIVLFHVVDAVSSMGDTSAGRPSAHFTAL
jgi:hypothetical protein